MPCFCRKQGRRGSREIQSCGRSEDSPGRSQARCGGRTVTAGCLCLCARPCSASCLRACRFSTCIVVTERCCSTIESAVKSRGGKRTLPLGAHGRGGYRNQAEPDCPGQRLKRGMDGGDFHRGELNSSSVRGGHWHEGTCALWHDVRMMASSRPFVSHASRAFWFWPCSGTRHVPLEDDKRSRAIFQALGEAARR
jgi:hypothetical protein